MEHFKETLKDDVRVVSALPSTLLMYKPTEEKNMPLNASPHWLRTHYGKKVHTYHNIGLPGTSLVLSLLLKQNQHGLWTSFSVKLVCTQYGNSGHMFCSFAPSMKFTHVLLFCT